MRICIPIRESTALRAQKKLTVAIREAEIIKVRGVKKAIAEVWLDRIDPAHFRGLFLSCRRPIVAVCRRPRDGGVFHGSEEERINVLIAAIQAGARFADCENDVLPRLMKKLKAACTAHRAKLIVSEHFWKNTPSLAALFSRVKRMHAQGADIIKIAAHIKHFFDAVTLFELTRRMVAAKQPIITVGMGEKGKLARIGCLLLGSYLTYSAVDEKSRTAPGQLTIKDLWLFK